MNTLQPSAIDRLAKGKVPTEESVISVIRDVGESLLIISYSVIVICYQLLVEKKTGLRAQD